MNSPVERFKNRRAILDGKAIPNTLRDVAKASALVEATIHSAVALRLDDEVELISADADTLLAEIHGRIDDEKISALIDACQKECLQAVIRPFGLGGLLFNDKLGGNVATIHNVRSKEYQKSDNTAWSGTVEQANYNDRGSYEYAEYHDRNASFREAREQVEVGYDLDHPVSCVTIHGDAGVYLAGLKGSDVANISDNHSALSSYYNRAKGSRGAEEFVKTLPALEPKRLNAIKSVEAAIHDLELNQNRTEQQNEILCMKKKALILLRDAPPIDPKKVVEVEARAKSAINKRINKTYYTSKKFIKNTVLTSVSEGGKMALQQAIGVLMEEFVRAAFAEVKDVWKTGFKGSVDDSFLDALKERLMRVAQRVQAKWKGAATAALEGGISGFLSNLVTVLINAFATTSARIVRMLREGFMSLYRALKTLAFPPEGLSLAEAADAASKLLAAGLVTSGGILLEVALEPHLQVLGPLAPYVSSIGVGVATGLATVSVVYMLDYLDIFGVNAKLRHEQVVAKLDNMISISYERALEAASVFGGPALLQST